jgi:arsenite/tail-anchored protein-transporting ATPase
VCDAPLPPAGGTPPPVALSPSLMAKRILLFTGKGGVGKTTCAAATALEAARRGHRTLVLSSDPAHSLADALDRPLGPEPQEIVPGLHAQEVDLYYSMKKYWGNMRDLMLSVFTWQGVDRIAAEEMAALPGMGEASALLWLDRAYRSEAYDLIVLDSAPTGETLTLLTLPQVAQWWVSKAFPFQKATVKTVGFAVRKTTGVPIDRGYAELERLFGTLAEVQKVLQDPKVTSTRLVLNPERMVIQEARRAYTYLQLYGYGVDAVVVNRVIPEGDGTGVLAKYVEAQRGYLEEIEGSFAPLPVFRVPHVGEEVFGLELLGRIGAELYGERDPAEVFHAEAPYRMEADGGAYVLSLHLPFVEAGDAHAEQFADELVVNVRNQRRNYGLPNFLAYYHLTRAEMDGDWLRARFEPTDAARSA